MTNVVAVRFRSGCKSYYFDPKDLLVRAGQDVIVETAQGLEFAQCTEGNHAVPDETVVQPLRPIVRIATDNDRHTAEYNRGRESEAFDICQKKILQHGMDMKLVRVECSFDGSKILFFFTADGRVDFRDLVKDLAGVFRSRIELRQIGVRDEAKMLGGLGICGRPFCCASYLDEFVPVSIKMAKTQNLSLNPTKISGTCGRLMCCLKYEQDAYEDALHRMPKADSFVMTPDGPGNVSSVSLLKETLNVSLDDRPGSPRCYHNCEVCVLRNGKGSRDGIAVPSDRPERYVEPVAREDALMPHMFGEDFFSESPTDIPAAEESRPARRRSRGGRRRGGSQQARSTESVNSAAPERSAVVPVERLERTERPEGSSGEKRPSRHRRGRGGQGGKVAGAAPNAAAPSTGIVNAPKRDEGTPGSARRPRHRGGRRHGGHSGNSTNTGSNEA